MASYKVLQDIEAEDTLIGPLTLRQCIYAAIAAVAAYLSFISIAKHVPYLVIFLLPFVAFGAFFAFPWSKQQSTEIWALAKVRFYFKPRIRIWNQSGVKELVTITAPPAVKKPYSRNLSPTEVDNRLKALADTIDSRGWAVKNVDMGYLTHGVMTGQDNNSDRLVDASNLPQDVPNYDVAAIASSDMFDVENNPVAQKFDIMMSQSADTHRQQIIQQMSGDQQQPAAGTAAQQPAQPSDYWHLQQNGISPNETPYQYNTAAQPNVGGPQYDLTLPAPVYAEAPSQPATSMQSVLQPQAAVNTSTIDYTNIRMPSATQPASGPTLTAATTTDQQVTPPPNPAILELANNNDLNVATIAREAQARNPELPNEVVVSLH